MLYIDNGTFIERSKNLRTEQHRFEIYKENIFKKYKEKLAKPDLLASHAEKNNGIKNLNITHIQLGMRHIYTLIYT